MKKENRRAYMKKENGILTIFQNIGKDIKVQAKHPSFWVEQILDIFNILSIYLYISGIVPGLCVILSFGSWLLYEIVKNIVHLIKNL